MVVGVQYFCTEDTVTVVGPAAELMPFYFTSLCTFAENSGESSRLCLNFFSSLKLLLKARYTNIN